jgi:hypothetical protein
LSGGPGDHVDTVDAIVSIGLEHTFGISSSPHIDPAGAIPGLDERVAALGLTIAGTSVRRARHHHRRRQLVRQHQVSRQRDAVAHRDGNVEPPGEAAVQHGGRAYPQQGDEYSNGLPSEWV